jgi:hypothetical protein
MEPEGSLPCSKPRATFHNLLAFYGEELLVPHPTPHPLLDVCDCLFNTFTATLHNWRPFLHPQPKNMPCQGDWDSRKMANSSQI